MRDTKAPAFFLLVEKIFCPLLPLFPPFIPVCRRQTTCTCEDMSQSDSDDDVSSPLSLSEKMAMEDLPAASKQLRKALLLRAKYMDIAHQSFPNITRRFIDTSFANCTQERDTILRSPPTNGQSIHSFSRHMCLFSPFSPLFHIITASPFL